MDLAGQASQVLRRADPEEGDLSDELFTSMIEAKSEVSSTAAEATATLREARREVLASGSRLIGAGVHPSAESGEADVRESARYLAIARMLQGILRTPICGQHVHVGMPDAETAVRAYNGIRTHVPLINALAANSPFWFGEDSGLASSRTVIFRSYPRAAMAPQFADFDDFCRVTRQVCAAADLDDYTHIWWDARIHPGLGTIEVRAPDAQFDLRRVAALAALVHCLARVEAERDHERIPAREALAESAFQATRHGLGREAARPARPNRGGDRARHAHPGAGMAGRRRARVASAELAYVETDAGAGLGRRPSAGCPRRGGHGGAAPLAVRANRGLRFRCGSALAGGRKPKSSVFGDSALVVLEPGA